MDDHISVSQSRSSRLGFSETGGLVGKEHSTDVSSSTAKGERNTDVIIHLIRGRDMVSS